ncbi:hypothetical protein GE107_15375 [Cohnella sp. CFH 77786]|uniref:hypothetical protein n=1 Tax=Cohnella sp. CFH 77786 TaxID=2662265 RepID=UPI001C60F146|nr:hypothetical protein [Cohnella sp. CFH 77786]MBW5447438.1 hypothetical protein [Cohnella sp. CFH 77786]
MSTTTPNLGLFKRDPATEGNEYFNIQQQINDPLDVIDSKVGGELVAKAPNTISLTPGVQIITGSRKSRVRNVKMTGRTLVNLLGRNGNCESTTPWLLANATVSLDTVNFVLGTNGIKITTTGTNGNTSLPVYMTQNSYYLLVGYVKHGTGTSTQINIGGNISANAVTGTTAFTLSYKAGQWTAASGNALLNVVVSGPSGSIGYVDGLRVYEITASESANINGMTTANALTYISTNYPYVDDMKHVNAVYVRNPGKNLLPPYSEWTRIHANAVILDSYKLTHTKTSGSAESSTPPSIPAVPSTTYSINPGGARMRVYESADGSSFAMIKDVTVQDTFTTSATTKFILVEAFLLSTDAGTFTWNQPMLNIGSTAITFEPQQSSYLYLPDAQIRSNVDGSVADKLELDGEGKPYATRRFREMTLDGSLNWALSADFTGFKRVNWGDAIPNYTSASGKITVTKFDGKILAIGPTNTSADCASDGAASTLYITIADTDSGWGESYTPTAAEIQAYFYGWFMMDLSTGLPYNGTGTKGWCEQLARGITSGTNTTTLPTQMSTYGGYKPYRLMYQFAQSVTEYVSYEGELFVHDGPNKIEVGTGVVVRETAKPKSDGAFYLISIDGSKYAHGAGSETKYRTLDFLGVYRNQTADKGWTKIFASNAYGKVYLRYPVSTFDQTAAYSVTYLALDTYALGIAPQSVTAEYAPNIKETVDSLARGLTEARTEISVLRNVKAGKQQPQWIAPLLLNGWVAYALSYPTAQYFKDELGIVHLRGLIKSGTVSPGTILFYLPKGYRPSLNLAFGALNYDGSTIKSIELAISTSGAVSLSINSGNVYLSFEGITFLAEQ